VLLLIPLDVADKASKRHLAGKTPEAEVNIASSQDIADIRVWPTYGIDLVNYVNGHLGSPVSEAWFATMDGTVNGSSGDSCPNFNTNYTMGGGTGFHGCGAFYVQTLAETLSKAQANAWTRGWTDTRDNRGDSTGGSQGWIYYHCNYDCNTYPMTK
jgi:hypothetical protein